MTDIRRAWTILARHAVGIRGERAQAVGIAHGAVENVGAEQRNLLVHFRIHVEDQLVLVVEAGGLHEEDRARR